MYNIRDDISKPTLDKKTYRYFQLTSNDLKVLVIHDPAAVKAAASMNVNVGHWCDPDDIPGVAHFCEHMLFMGTAKFPDENHYSAFLSQHGGTSNAFTAAEDTNYYFDVSVESFKEALEIFSRFFIDPLMDEKSTERELLAVDSEYANCLMNDNWRYVQLRNSASNSTHPTHKFGTGNKTTLSSPKTRQALLDFHEKHYKASNMSLCVISRDSIDDLCALVVKLFSDVKPGVDKHQLQFTDLETNQRLIPLAYGPNHTAKWYSVVPVKDFRVTRLVFPLPPSSRNYLRKSSRYLSHLVGHEGAGSIFQVLQQMGWTTALVAGEMVSTTDYDLFGIDISLTPEGQENINRIISLIFSYFQLIRDSGIPEWIYEECRKISHVEFKFKGASETIKVASNMSTMMSPSSATAVEHLIEGPYIFAEFDRQEILELLNLMVPSNLIAFICSRSFKGKTDQVEPWYGTEYSSRSFTPQDMEQWGINIYPESKMLHLPSVNYFIPNNFEIVGTLSTSPSLPKKIRDDEQCVLWFKQDDTFLQPKAAVRFSILTSEVSKSPLSTLLAQLFTLICQEDLSEVTYNATVAGFNGRIESQHEGFSVYLQGYTSSLLEVAHIMFSYLGKFSFNSSDPNRLKAFESQKEKLHRQYKNYTKGSAYQVANYMFQFCTNNRFTIQQRLAVFDELTPQRLEAWIKTVFAKCYLRGLVHGNLLESDALRMADDLLDILRCEALSRDETPCNRMAVIPCVDHEYYVHNLEHEDAVSENSSIYYYFQFGASDLLLDTKAAMLSHLLEEPSFDILRTKQQLGYIVWVSDRYIYGSRGLAFTIQSNTKDPVYLQERIFDFLQQYQITLKEMSEEEFKLNVNGLIAILEEKDRELFAESDRYWNEIVGRTCLFDRPRREVEILRGLEKQSIVDLLDMMVTKCPRLVIRVFRNGSKIETTTNEKEIVLPDLTSWKSDLEWFPNPPLSVSTN